MLAGGAGMERCSWWPTSDLVSPMILTAPTGGQMFWSFLLALVVSSAITAAAVLARRVSSRGDEFDFGRLRSDVRLIDEPVAADD